ncbi:dolichol kinase EVAN-like isoform X2 [Papaver somniferum]|uniref:dolichol kinase EVAN-like isoform X2 n=1 Tax=Papaver somniferum TaxID=3469 RepID=UPI000E6FCD05|nr:dolichol kinase EVAN-like isoform X2 [Papaver somniferum]
MATSAVSLFNGERTVVVLFLTRILFCIPKSLYYESLGLCLLAFAGLFIEISAENSSSLNQFKPRPGASSGILLGAVTLPSVMLSRLIQLSRAVESKDIGPQELDYLIVQYWAVSATCFGVLLFLCCLIRHSTNATSLLRFRSSHGTEISLLYMSVYVAVCCFSLARQSDFGSHLAMKLFWVFCHGLAAVKLIQHFLHAFPSCASIGEALLVTSGLVLYFGDMTAYTLAKLNTFLISRELLSELYGFKRSEIITIIQGFLISLLVFPVFYGFFLRIYHQLSGWISPQTRAAEETDSKVIERSLLFYASLIVTLVMNAPAWMQFVQGFHHHPLLWILNFVFEEPLKRLALCIYWVSVICASVLRFYNISKSSKIERILLRKYYHLVAVLMFSPALIFQSSFLDLAFGAALAVFLILEIVRVWKIWPLGKHINQFMNAFTDHRDSEFLIVSHFSLLLGCALPKWLSTDFNDRPLAPFAGILSLGIGDTMASMVGYKYGVLRCSKTGKKTIEGTAAGITSVLAACSVLLPLLASTGFIISQHWISLLIAVTASGLLEAYTAQLDNAFIPLVFYSLLCL